MENVTRAEHQSSMDRVHGRVDSSDKSVARQEVIVERIEKSVDRMHAVMFGNGREGLVTKVSNLIKDRWLIRVILLSIIGLAFYIIKKGV